MILIADSGSTKTDWTLCDGNQTILTLKTAGMNPFFQTKEAMEKEIEEMLFPSISSYPIDSVFFYGAGCADDEKKQLVANVLGKFISAHIEADSDLMAAARALCGHKKGIACILGTGSNSCLYDGKTITQHVSPLGFILGDEGSGADLGKRLVSDCLKHQFSPDVEQRFMDEYQLTPSIVLDRVYKQPFPSRFLASLQPFLFDNIIEPSIHELVLDSFKSFFLRNVLHYHGAFKLPVNFVGSIAYIYHEQLQEAAESLGLSIGIIMRSPMEGLINYHTKK
jgi:N-acetylglucosamine kinase-like BadF-type ATPase